MSEWLDAIDRALPHGTVLRFPAAWPYEDMVDFMVVNFPTGMGLVVTTGYKAGLIVVILPSEAMPAGVLGISSRWLARNWTIWVWPDGDAAQVEVLAGYPPPAP